jgi:DNA polymerase-3 subunit beta
MNININKSEILKSLLLVNVIINKSCMNPILTNILFITRDDTIEIIAANDNIAIKTSLKNNTVNPQEEKILIEGDLITKLIEKSNSEEILIELIEERVLRIKAGKFISNINLPNEEDYPRYDFETANKSETEIDGSIFNVIFSKLLKITNSKNVNVGKMFEGILIDTQTTSNVMQITATDTYHLASISESYTGAPFKIVINQESIKLINAQLKSKKVKVYAGKDGRILIKNDNIMYNSKLIEGEYPSTKKIIDVAPETLGNSFKVNKKDFINAVEKAQIISSSNDNKTNTIKLEIKETLIKVIGQNIEKGNLYEELPISGPTEKEATIILNATLLLNLLKNIDSKEALIAYASANTAIYIADTNNKNYKSIIMPTRY